MLASTLRATHRPASHSSSRAEAPATAQSACGAVGRQQLRAGFVPDALLQAELAADEEAAQTGTRDNHNHHHYHRPILPQGSFSRIRWCYCHTYDAASFGGGDRMLHMHSSPA
eukprot:gnl/TRDRNA2_/TRDRNA2_170262_c2_seq1.p2 gnl/TRDRNA2_/TRDRNA2_170262_c2~~gnl/TRDRNA2_/TRDRNA2_170262_c2_seq1.p2  ORF type:complete len:113 (-),score=10.00 gnl/TRDRNA2_/TRDRNA2_170262_c2_seq1:157-495(-)